ncbi:MAG: alpha/beta hydrolase [Alphaproteobacteria bacterium]|nr:alpha/beta hydrolase [Alphaproteobacteria bacterium]
MPLHPVCRKLIKAAKTGSVFDARDPAQARAAYEASVAALAPPTPELARIENRTIASHGRALAIRLYRPVAGAGGRRLPGLLFVHGGGWVFGSLDSHDAMCRILAHEAQALVLALDYRLAPEHKLPAALDDTLTAWRWFATEATALKADPARLAIAGDSAGGSIAAAACQQLRDAGDGLPIFQLLLYPGTDFSASGGSLKRFATGHLLTAAAIAWFAEQYLPTPDDALDPRASPLLADTFEGLPPAFIQTAEYDPFRDQGIAYAERLAAAGVAVEQKCYAGMLHGFARMGGVLDAAFDALEDAAAALRQAFARKR